MPNLEKIGFYIAAVIQIFAIVWWASTLNAAVKRQEKTLEVLVPKVSELNVKVIRIEDKTLVMEKQIIQISRDSNNTQRVLRRIEDLLDGN